MATTKKASKVTTAVAIDALDIDKMRNAILAANQIDVDAKNTKTTAGIERLRISSSVSRRRSRSTAAGDFGATAACCLARNCSSN